MKTILVKANHKNRTFTLRSFINGKLIVKYHTIKLDKDEFNSCLNNTINDWHQFLKSDDYYIVGR